MNCKNCGALVSTEVRDGVFVCDYCHTENIIQKEPIVKEPDPNEIDDVIRDKAPIDFNQLANSIVRIQSKNGSATGFFMHENGYILTNAHVVEGQPFVQGFIGDSPRVNEFEVRADGSVIGIDLALLEALDDSENHGLKLSKDAPALGDTVYAVGNPRNLGLSVSKGAISRIKPGEYQLDMTLNPGNSGGPVLNEDAELVGIVSYLLEEVNGISFAIDIKTIQAFLEKAIQEELVPHYDEEEEFSEITPEASVHEAPEDPEAMDESNESVQDSDTSGDLENPEEPDDPWDELPDEEFLDSITSESSDLEETLETNDLYEQALDSELESDFNESINDADELDDNHDESDDNEEGDIYNV